MKYARPTKAVIIAAGFGTRFLPQTKAMPKEMLPVVDKPIIQYVVEDLVKAGIDTIIIVTGYGKRSIEDHFDSPTEALVANLKMSGPKKQHLLDEIEAIANLANFVYVRQRKMYGNGVPLLDIEHLIGDEAFIYAFADELIPAKPNLFEQVIAYHAELQGQIFPCVRVERDRDFDNFGIVDGKEVKPGVLRMNRIIEKPGRKAAPSSLASHGGYVFTPKFFDYIEAEAAKLQPGQELSLQSAAQAMIDAGEKLFACEVIGGKFRDTGSKLDYLKTVVEFALEREDIAKEFRAYLKDKVS